MWWHPVLKKKISTRPPKKLTPPLEKISPVPKIFNPSQNFSISPPPRKFLNPHPRKLLKPPPPKISQPPPKKFPNRPLKFLKPPPPPRKFLNPPPRKFFNPPENISTPLEKISTPKIYEEVTHPPPPPTPFFFLSLFLHFSKKNLKLSAWPEVRGTADTDGGAYSPFRSILLVLTYDFIIIQLYGPACGDG